MPVSYSDPQTLIFPLSEKDLYMMILELIGKHEEILKFLKEESMIFF